ncbi:hypothetical protein JCM10003_2752 [Bacteroides pyogenes JCM 10003]|nr:hypothetical protein JCM10003_2752 [Bacteroides pyogenes JCM 10003]
MGAQRLLEAALVAQRLTPFPEATMLPNMSPSLSIRFCSKASESVVRTARTILSATLRSASVNIAGFFSHDTSRKEMKINAPNALKLSLHLPRPM